MQLNQQTTTSEELNGFISNSAIYTTSLTATETVNNNPTVSKSGVPALSTTTIVSAKENATVTQKTPIHAETGDTKDIFLTQQLQESNKRDQQSKVVANDIRPHLDSLQKGKSIDSSNQVLDVRKFGDRRSSSPFQNGRTEVLIGTDDNKFKTVATVESNNNKLEVDGNLR